MMLLNHIVAKCTDGYKPSKLQKKKNNHLIYMDDVKLLAKNEKELETLIQGATIYFVWFGLVSLFNGISPLFRLFNAKAILLEEQ